MKYLKLKYAGDIDYVGTRRYVVLDEDDKEVAIIFTKEKSLVVVANNYRNAKRDDDVIIEFDKEDETREY